MADVICKTCKYWKPPASDSYVADPFNGMGWCGYVDSDQISRICLVALDCRDEHGYSAGCNNSLRTSPWFGCIRHEEVES